MKWALMSLAATAMLGFAATSAQAAPMFQQGSTSLDELTPKTTRLTDARGGEAVELAQRGWRSYRRGYYQPYRSYHYYRPAPRYYYPPRNRYYSPYRYGSPYYRGGVGFYGRNFSLQFGY